MNYQSLKRTLLDLNSKTVFFLITNTPFEVKDATLKHARFISKRFLNCQFFILSEELVLCWLCGDGDSVI